MNYQEESTTLSTPLRRKRGECAPYSHTDCDVLYNQLLKAGYIALYEDVAWAWYKHSDSLCATWLCVSSDEPERNVDDLLKYLEPAI